MRCSRCAVSKSWRAIHPNSALINALVRIMTRLVATDSRHSQRQPVFQNATLCISLPRSLPPFQDPPPYDTPRRDPRIQDSVGRRRISPKDIIDAWPRDEESQDTDRHSSAPSVALKVVGEPVHGLPEPHTPHYSQEERHQQGQQHRPGHSVVLMTLNM